MTNKLIDFYNTLSEKQKERLMYHVDKITNKDLFEHVNGKWQPKFEVK